MRQMALHALSKIHCRPVHLIPAILSLTVDRPADHVAQEHPMLDIVMLALGLGFFAAGIGYAYACERL